MNIVSKGFGGIDRSKSTFDKNFRSAEVAKDVELFPTGRLLGRAGYLALYKSDVIYPLNPMGQGEERDQPAVLPTSDTNYDSVVGTPETGGVHLGDAGGDNIRIVAIYEWEQPDYGGGTTQRHVIQCSNSLFYRYHFGLHPGWVVLENTYQNDLGVTEWFWERLRPVLTRGGMAITSRPIPSPHAHFWDSKGVLRMGLGTGAKAIPLWYGRIDRKFFISAINFNNWMLDVTPLQPPREDNAYTNANEALGHDNHAVYSPTHYGRLAADPGAFDAGSLWDSLKDWYTLYNAENKMDDALELYNSVVPFLVYDGVDGANNAAWRWSDGISPVDQFIDGEDNLIYFYVGISYIYDGSQESQIYNVTNTDISRQASIDVNKSKMGTLDAIPVGCALSDAINPSLSLWNVIVVRLKLGLISLNTVDGDDYPDRTSPRVTSIRIWLGRLEHRSQTTEQTNFYPVKSIIVSQEDAFKDDLAGGNYPWKIGDNTIVGFDDNHYHFLTVIGANDWLAGLEAGDYRKINGHNFPLIDDTFGLQRSPFLEGYSYAEEIKDRVVYGDIRWDGQLREKDVVRDAVFSELGSFGDTPDVIDGSVVQLDNDVMGLKKLDDDTLCIVESAQVEKRSMPDLVKLDISNGGCSAHDSIIKADGVIMFYKDGQQFMYDGVHDPIVVSDRIARDSDDGTYKGLSSTFDNTNVWSFFLPVLRKQFIFAKHTDADTWHAFVYDVRVKKWVEFKFGHIIGSTIDEIDRSFVAGCRGVDGEMDFTDGLYIYRYPLGLHDGGVAIDPQYQYSDVEFPARVEVALDDLYMNHKTTGATDLRVTIRRDRGDLTAITKDFDASTENIAKVTKPFTIGTRAEKCISIKFNLTTPNTSTILHVENVRVDATDQESV